MAEFKDGTTIKDIRAFPFSIGTVLMFDGTSWVDNATLPGWYACVPENEDGGSAGLFYGIQSFVDRFIMGSDEANKGIAGGANTGIILVDNLPNHYHGTYHTHSAVTVTSGVDFTALGGKHRHTVRVPNSWGDANGGGSRTSLVYTAGQWTGYTNHTHSYSLSTSYTGIGSNNAENRKVIDSDGVEMTSQYNFQKRPAYYSAIIIQRCV